MSSVAGANLTEGGIDKQRALPTRSSGEGVVGGHMRSSVRPQVWPQKQEW